MNSPSSHTGSTNIGCLGSKILLPAAVVAIVAAVVIKLTPSSRHENNAHADSVTQLFQKIASDQEGLLPSILFFKEHRKEVQDFIEKFMTENVTMDKNDDVLVRDLSKALQREFPPIQQYPQHFSLSLASIYEISLGREAVRHIAASFGTTQHLSADDKNGDNQGDGYEDIRINHQFSPEDGRVMKPGEALFAHYETVQKYLDDHIDDIQSKLQSSPQKWGELSEIEFMSALVDLFPRDSILQGYILGDFTVQREIFLDKNGRLKMRVSFSVPYRKDEPYIIEISLPHLIQV